MPADRVPSLTHPAEGVAVLDRRQVALNEIGAEAEQVAGLGKVVEGEGRLAKGLFISQTQPVRGQQFVGEMVG